jgi:hypothetical protein
MAIRSTIFATLTILIAFLAPFGAVSAQAPALGSEFIFFVEGRNVSIPRDVSIDFINDPTTAGNRVVQFNQGNWNNFEGFNWPNGVDLTANIAAGDSIFFRIWSSVRNSVAPGRPRFIMLDSSPTDNIRFRLYYNFPDSVHSSQWINVAIPFPQLTRNELDSAKVGKNPDGTPRQGGALSAHDARWEYWGAWDNREITSVTHPDWREFKFDRTNNFGMFWDQPDPSFFGPIYIDDFYIGRSNTDLEKTKNPPPPASGLAAVSQSSVNTVSWTRGADISAYNVYFSGTEITDIADPGVFFWKTVNSNETLSLNHQIVSPHPDEATHTYHYAVTATNLWSTENRDVTQSRISVEASGRHDSYIFKFTPQEEAAVLNSLDTRTLSTAGFPTTVIRPFEMKASSSAAFPRPPTDDIVSGKAWVGYGDSEGEIIFYTYIEVLDNDLLYTPFVDTQGTLDWNAYKRDQVVMRMGSYSVNFVTGSTNRAIGRGDNPDYTLAFLPTTKDDKVLAPRPFPDSKLYVRFGGLDNYPFAFEPLLAPINNQAGAQIGYKMLVAFEAAKLREPIDFASDIAFTAPAANEIKYIPFSLTIVDDAIEPDRPLWWENNRYFVTTSWKPAFSPMQQPSDFAAVAIAGANKRTATSIDERSDAIAGQYRLDQNYPNPFNPSTAINFTLPEAANVTLTVYNALGQTVATLVNQRAFSQGTHSVSFDATGLSSGVYLYRIEAGSYTSTRKMLLMK